MHLPSRETLAASARQSWAFLRRFPPQLLLVPLAGVLLYVLALLPFTPTPAELRKAKQEQASVMLAADGSVLAEFKHLNRDWKPLKEISPHVLDALVATEDHRFFKHHGIDFRRTAGAALNTFRGERQGGSTITQQLARNLYPEEIGNAPSLTRKIKEALTALKIEAHFSKNEILETYLNTVPFLYNAVGVEMASRTYFDKPASHLDVLESATLVGMLKGTSQYNPVQNPQRSLLRRNLVLQQMARGGFVSADQLDALQGRPLVTTFGVERAPLGPAPHLAQQIRTWLAEWANKHDRDLDTESLVVRTTIDPALQAAANEAVAAQLKRLQPLAMQRSREQPLQAGFLAIDPRGGEVRAWVGSSNFTVDQFDHVQQARRQPGSTFKPFVYGAAFAHGMQPTDVLLDQAVTFGKGRSQWTPQDAAPPTMQPMTLADGLAYSRNRITAQVMQKVKPSRVADLAKAMGVRDSKLDEVPSLALGTSPVTLKEMVTAYSTIARGGQYVAPIMITQVEDRKGNVLERFHTERPERALGAAETRMLVEAMRGVVDRGTGRAIREVYGIRADVAGKTGTTQSNTDGWFILMHPQLVAGAWVGFNDSRITMGDSWGPGASSALPIVGAVFQQALMTRRVDQNVTFQQAVPAQEEAGWWARMMGGSKERVVTQAPIEQQAAQPAPSITVLPPLPQGAVAPPVAQGAFVSPMTKEQARVEMSQSERGDAAPPAPSAQAQPMEREHHARGGRQHRQGGGGGKPWQRNARQSQFQWEQGRVVN